MIIYIFFIAHFLADFTFQSTKLAHKKIHHFKYLIYHALIYAAIFLIAIFPFIKFEKAVFSYILIVMSHFFVDWIRTCVDKKIKSKVLIFASFTVDQIVHISILAIISYAFNLGAETTDIYIQLQHQQNFNNLVVCFLIFVALWDPAAVFIKKLFTYIIEENNCVQEENDPQVGRIIGKLERIIISVLILCNQYGAIGFVLTAKSIARYKQLEDKNFAEKYLVGTLTSISIAFLTTIILKQLLK